VNIGIIYEWVLDRVPRPYELSTDVPGRWEEIQVSPQEAERLLRSGNSWRNTTEKTE